MEAQDAVRTAGVDLSSQDRKSAACVVEWSDSGASILTLKVGVADTEIARLISEVDRLGIDVPLGWPIGNSVSHTTRARSGQGSPCH